MHLIHGIVSVLSIIKNIYFSEDSEFLTPTQSPTAKAMPSTRLTWKRMLGHDG